MYLSSFAGIATSMQSDISQVQYSLSAYFIGLAVGQLGYAPIVSRYGLKRPLLIGSALYAIAAMLQILTTHIEIFISLRALQTIGGCAGMVIGRIIIQQSFDRQESARVLSLMMMIQGVAPIAAPVLGSLCYHYWGWRSVFLFQILFAIICIAASWRWVNEGTVERNNLGEVIRQFLTLLKKRDFAGYLASSSLALATMFIFISASPFVYISLFSLTARQYGLLFASCAAGMMISGQLNRMLLRHYSVVFIYRLALVLQCIGAVLLLAAIPSGSLWWFTLPLYLCIATIPVIGGNGTALAMSAGGKAAASASSLIGVLQFAMASIASALVSVLANGSSYPMAGLITTVAIAAVIIDRGLTPRHQQ